MKNTNFPRLAIPILIISLVLSGCFGFFEKDKDDEEVLDTTPVAVETRPAADVPNNPVQAAPSFQDGDLYLQAIRSKDIGTCAQIQNEKLKGRCETRLSGG